MVKSTRGDRLTALIPLTALSLLAVALVGAFADKALTVIMHGHHLLIGAGYFILAVGMAVCVVPLTGSAREVARENPDQTP